VTCVSVSVGYLAWGLLWALHESPRIVSLRLFLAWSMGENTGRDRSFSVSASECRRCICLFELPDVLHELVFPVLG